MIKCRPVNVLLGVTMNQNILRELTAESNIREDVKEIKIGHKLKVHYNITEGDKKRIQVFEGLVIARNNNGLSSTFTVRKISFNGIGVERVFPIYSPLIEKIEFVALHKVRRAKLNYIKGLSGKAARLKVKERYFNKK